jgi:hypothetical protein
VGKRQITDGGNIIILQQRRQNHSLFRQPSAWSGRSLSASFNNIILA